MNGIPTSYLTSMLPQDARTSRIAARGGLATHAHSLPADGHMIRSESSGSRADALTQGRTAHCIEASRVRLRPATAIERQPNETIHHN